MMDTGKTGQGHMMERLLGSLVSLHHLSPELSNHLLEGLLASRLVSINPHLVVPISHLKLANSFPQPSGEKLRFFNKAHKALMFPLPNSCPLARLSDSIHVSTVPSNFRSDTVAHEWSQGLDLHPVSRELQAYR